MEEKAGGELSLAHQIQELLEGTLDTGFILEPDKVESIIALEVVKENFVAVLSNVIPLAHKEILKLTDLKNELFVLFPKNIAPSQYEKLNALFNSSKF